MAFNSNTYRANKNAREAWSHLAKARDIKARRNDGTAYEWESVERNVQHARFAMHTALHYRRMKQYAGQSHWISC